MIRSLDINECLLRTSKCSSNAQCINTQGSYSCKCHDGYEGDGETCYDKNECNDYRNPCNFKAVCRNTDGSYTCSCKTGFQGDGQWCYDYDECMRGIHDCHQKAVCVNTPGSYRCTCSRGYHGNGQVCEGEGFYHIRHSKDPGGRWILDRVVPPGSPNPDPFSDQNIPFSTPVFRPRFWKL